MVLFSDSSIYGWGTVTGLSSVQPIGAGDGGNTYRSTPVLLVNTAFAGKTMIAVSASYSNGMALASDGSIYAFGDNTYYQTGDGVNTQTPRTTMSSVDTAASYSLLNGDYYSSIFQGVGISTARTNYGRFIVWGDTSMNACGWGTPITPAFDFTCQVDLFNRNLSSTFYSSPNSQSRYNESFTILGTDGCETPVPLLSRNYTTSCNVSYYSWGANTYGQIGDRGIENRLSAVTPFIASDFGGERVVELRYSAGFSVALGVSGKLYSWGLNTAGSLGNGTNTTFVQAVPTMIASQIITVSCGVSSCIALRSDAILLGWGGNVYGELGDGTTTGKTLPTAITRGRIGNKIIMNVKMGSYHTVVLTSGMLFIQYLNFIDNSLFSWGKNDLGQCGVGDSTAYYNLPKSVNITGNVTHYSVGGNHNMVLTSNLYVWGSLQYGDPTPVLTGPGDGSSTFKTLPQLATPALSQIVSIKTGLYHALVLLRDGSFYLAGDQSFVQVCEYLCINIIV